jgi:hypothetical protein
MLKARARATMLRAGARAAVRGETAGAAHERGRPRVQVGFGVDGTRAARFLSRAWSLLGRRNHAVSAVAR